MKRRKFLLTSGTALLGSTAVQSVNQEPAIALNFDLVGVENVQPSSTDTILVDFENFELIPKYVDETAGDATITITLDIEGFNPKQTESDVNLTNGNKVTSSDLGSAVPIVQDGINSAQTSLDGTITINITHPELSDSYKQDFTITDDPLQDGLVGYWPLHEWGRKAQDLSGNKNNGTVNNGVDQGVAGVSGLTAYSFNGSDGYVEIGKGGSNSVTGYGPFTMSAWVRPNNASVRGTVLSRDNGTGDRHSIGITGNGEIGHSYYDGSNYHTAGTSTSSDNKWYHIIGVADGSQITAYINGDFYSEGSLGSNTYSDGDGSEIGRSGNNQSTAHLGGKIADVRIYNRALSDSEAQQLYNLGIGDYTNSSLHDGSDSASISRWKLNRDTTDSWGSNDGTDKTSTNYSSNSIRGRSKLFNSSNNDYINITDSNSLDVSDSITLCAWIRPQIEDARSIMTKDGAYQLQTRSDASDNSVSVQMGLYSNGALSEWSRTKDLSPLDEWSHVAGTYDGDKIRTYVNGVLEDQVQYSQDISTNTEDLRIGDDTGSSIYWYDGSIDDARIYGRALNPSEVQQLYQWGTRGQDLRERTTTKNKNDMVGWWKLNETNGTTAYDSSGNGNNGNITGAGPAGTGTVQNPLGEKAYRFDGSDDSIEASYIPEISKNKTYTVSVWINPNSGVSNRHVWQNSAGSGNDRNGMEWENPRMSFGYYDGSSYTSIGGDIQSDKWSHFVGINNQGSLKAYIDGIEVTKNPNLNIDVDNKLLIGEGGTADTGYWKGEISDLRVYNRTLTPQEVSYLYEQKF